MWLFVFINIIENGKIMHDDDSDVKPVKPVKHFRRVGKLLNFSPQSEKLQTQRKINFVTLDNNINYYNFKRLK